MNGCIFLWLNSKWLHQVGPSCSIDSNSWDVADDRMRVKLQIVVRILLAFCGSFLFFHQTLRRSVHGKTESMTQFRIERDVLDEADAAVTRMAQYFMRGRVEKAGFDNRNSTFARTTETTTHVDGVGSDKASVGVASPNGTNLDYSLHGTLQLEECPQNSPDLGKFHQAVGLCHCNNSPLRKGVIYYDIPSLKYARFCWHGNSN